MHEQDVQAREDPHSLAPIQLESASDEQEIAKIRGGRGLRLTLTVLCLAAAVLGGAQLLKSMDTHQAYAQAAAQLERADTEQGDAFMRCALPNLQRSQLETPSALHSAIEIATERMDKGYAKMLAKCTPLLESFQRSVKEIQGPADMTQRLAAVSNSANEFGQAWINYREYLQRPGQPYDYVQAVPLIDKITTSWQSYQSTRTQAKAALAAQH
jgi:hypothetical protein